MEEIEIPSNLTWNTIIPFSIKLNNVPYKESYLLNFKDLGHAEPFGMLLLAALLRQFGVERKQKQGNNVKFLAWNYVNKSYVSVMGLFKSFGLDHGNEPGQALGSSSYIPLKKISINRVIRNSIEEYVHHGEIIETESAALAKILTRNNEGAITDTLTYSIREIMRNVIEHSEASHIWIAAQYWPTKNRVEIAILDEGIGLLSSLKRNPKLTVDSDENALLIALQPGISGVPREKRRSRDGEWANTGYGLFMTSSLCKKGGNYLICSGSKTIYLEDSKFKLVESSYKGTAIRMVLDTRKIGDLDSSLNEIRIIGEKIANEKQGNAHLSASKMSRMLVRNSKNEV